MLAPCWLALLLSSPLEIVAFHPITTLLSAAPCQPCVCGGKLRRWWQGWPTHLPATDTNLAPDIRKLRLAVRMKIGILSTVHLQYTQSIIKHCKALHQRYEPSKALVSQSLSSKLTFEREMAHKALAHSSECVRDRLTRLLNSYSQLRICSKYDTFCEI